jgi:hypothetical protein
MLAVEDFKPQYYPRKGINFGTPHALPAYVVAVEAIEAFLNETFIVRSRYHIRDAPLWKLTKPELRKLERKSLKERLTLVPHLLVGKSLSPENSALQAMKLLIDVRNDLVHYKMENEWPGYMETFIKGGIGLNALEPKAFEPWPEVLSTSEGIRWANNTASEMAHAMYRLLPEHYQEFLTDMGNFVIMDDAYAKIALTLKGINPKSSMIP